LIGGFTVLAGLVIIAVSRFKGGRLPGDVFLTGAGIRVNFPTVSCLVVSVVLTIVLNLLLRRR